MQPIYIYATWKYNVVKLLDCSQLNAYSMAIILTSEYRLSY